MLAARLRSRDPLAGLLVVMPGLALVEMAALASFDFVLLDAEHGPGDALALGHHLLAGDAAGIPTVVRTPGSEESFILGALDAGAAGIVVPHVVDRAGAEAIVAAAHYPPRGHRGISLATRAGRFGARSLGDHLRHAAHETCVFPMIEDAEAVDRAGEILSVAGVNGVVVGTSDLSLSLGHPGDFEHPEVAGAIDSALESARAAGVPAFAPAGNVDQARRWRRRGAQGVVFNSPALMLRAFRDAAEGFQSPL
jgi:4-hydroxy-2-oxoheptanedioate aldolase